MATPVPTSPITVKKRTTARRGLFQSDGDASDATTSSEERSLSEEEEEEEPTTPLAPSEPSSAPTSPRDEDLARAEINARDAADAEMKQNARLAALDESWAAQEATIQLLEARATRRWKDAREANDRKQAAMERLAANEARRDLAQARAADARQAAQAARLEAADATSASADAKVQTARLEERVAAAAAKPEAVPAPPPPVPPDAAVQKQRARALADARVLAEEHDRLRFAVEKAEARLAAATEAADVREKIGAMATAQSDAKAREAIAAVRQLRDVVRDGDPRALAASAYDLDVLSTRSPSARRAFASLRGSKAPFVMKSSYRNTLASISFRRPGVRRSTSAASTRDRTSASPRSLSASDGSSIARPGKRCVLVAWKRASDTAT